MRRLRLQSTGPPQRSRDDQPDETNFSDLRREILDTLGDPDEHGTKGGFGGFAAICERELADPNEPVGSAPGEYSQKLGGKFAQGFCDATVNLT